MLDICRRFQVKAQPVSCQPYGNGHINTTYRVKTDGGPDYILQRLSRQAFHDIPALMKNVERVTAYLAQQDPEPRRSLHLVPTIAGGSYLHTEDGEFYRMYDFITNSVSLDCPERENDLYECAYAFGKFQRALETFPAEELSETILRFHDTPNRYRVLREAVEADKLGRRKDCEQEIAFALAREQEAASLMKLLKAGQLPLRVTHNDTKLNNVMLDNDTHQAVCVIDLDTVMPGLAAFDFGDLVRFGANTGREDEKNLSKISLSLPNYAKLLQGYLDACSVSLTEKELETLPLGGKLMTLECGVRFLTDYLMGDVYFHIQRPEHNLDRCRTQFALVASMEQRWDEMQSILSEAREKVEKAHAAAQ